MSSNIRDQACTCRRPRGVDVHVVGRGILRTATGALFTPLNAGLHGRRPHSQPKKKSQNPPIHNKSFSNRPTSSTPDKSNPPPPCNTPLNPTSHSSVVHPNNQPQLQPAMTRHPPFFFPPQVINQPRGAQKFSKTNLPRIEGPPTRAISDSCIRHSFD